MKESKLVENVGKDAAVCVKGRQTEAQWTHIWDQANEAHVYWAIVHSVVTKAYNDLLILSCASGCLQVSEPLQPPALEKRS